MIKTNADYIRERVKTDEGLADFVNQLNPDGTALHYCKNLESCEELVGTKELNKKCRQCLLDYLKKYTHDESGGN